MSIEFYSKTTAYHEFSNFSPHGVEMDGLWYPTVEHYFQAMKFPGHEHAEKIRLAAKPAIAKQLGRSRSVQLREDWEDIKIDVMRAAVRKEFTTHAELTQLLLETGDEELVEAAPADYFWGRGKSGTGQNWLGRILMEVRAELRTPHSGATQNV
jgi:ribA/ribD-fused uncharacterized protein